MSEKRKKEKKVRRTSIGGQAVMEGVMMRGATSMAVSVRDSNGDIRTETARLKPAKEKNILLRLPVIRGVANFLSMLITGVQILTKSAEVYAEDEESAAADQKKNKKAKDKTEKKKDGKAAEAGMGAAMVFAVVLGLGLAIALFFILPTLITDKLFTGVFGWQFNPIVQNLIEGAVRFAIFIGYLLSVSLVKDIRRTFMYHGAEHRVINCFESGKPMTVENVQKCSTIHNRCGTTFIFFVMLMSIIIFALFDGLMSEFGAGAFLDNVFLKILTKLALLPLVAGLSYELLKGLARTNFFLFWPLKAPGMLLQCITTKKPTDDMAEVALKSFNTVLEMDADPSIAPVPFAKPELAVNYRAAVQLRLKNAGVDTEADTDWIFCKVLGCKRGEIAARGRLTIRQMGEIDRYANLRMGGMPLQYALGETEFYGYPIKTDARALIPRFETELLAEQAVKCSAGKSTALDLCTGSGAIAVALKKKNPNLSVTASDLSADALALARENAAGNAVPIEFIESDLFEALPARKFDVIVSNPPYIPEKDIDALESVVKSHEPKTALSGGADGLEFYRRIASEAEDHLEDGGVLLLEVGMGQAQTVKDYFGNFQVEILKDLSGIERILLVKRGESHDRETEGHQGEI